MRLREAEARIDDTIRFLRLSAGPEAHPFRHASSCDDLREYVAYSWRWRVALRRVNSRDDRKEALGAGMVHQRSNQLSLSVDF